MRVTTTIAETRAVCSALRSSQPLQLGLVPTMGALHAGHLSLMEAARNRCDVVAASIFVNPTQFGPNEDLARYPRNFEEDSEQLHAAGVDLLFAPSPAEMYPGGGLGLSIDPGPLGDRLDGQSRPGHFRGVATVVSKLFHVIDPDLAFFGQKDAAQVAVLRAMVRDLNMRVRLAVCPTVRDRDGLALSSRNRYLKPDQRRTALAIPGALRAAEQQVQEGEMASPVLLAGVHRYLQVPNLRVDYVAAVDPDTLLPVESVREGTLLAVAAWVGETRLIDNLIVGSAAGEPSR